MYQLPDNITQAICNATNQSEIIKELDIQEASTHRIHLLLEFPQKVILEINPASLEKTMLNLLDGDKQLTKALESFCTKGVKVKPGLRWVGGAHYQTLEILGWALTISIQPNLVNDLSIKQMLSVFTENQWLSEERVVVLSEAIKNVIKSSERHTLTSKALSLFYHQKHPLGITQTISKLLNDGEAFIHKHIEPIKRAEKCYAGENAINPAFESLDQMIHPLQLNEKRIWLLRSDFNIVLGVKNAYQEMWGYYGLADIFDANQYAYINWEDRVGHPSLAMPEENYTGDAFYAGHIAQREGYLEVLNYSGRFDRHDLSEAKLKKMEGYMALRFQKAFGQQPVIFITNARNNFADYYELSRFYSDQTLIHESMIPKRRYDFPSIQKILAEQPQGKSNISPRFERLPMSAL